MYIYLHTHTYTCIHTHTHTHTHTGHGLDGSNEVHFFGQNLLEASCPWSTYLKRFPNFGLKVQTNSVKEWNVKNSKSRRERGSERGSEGSERGSANKLHERSNESDNIENNNNSNSNKIVIFDNSLPSENQSMIIDNTSDKNRKYSENNVEKSVKKEITETVISGVKYRNLRGNSVNLSVTSSVSILRNKSLVENSEIESKSEFESKADVMYTFDSSLDNIHSEVRQRTFF